MNERALKIKKAILKGVWANGGHFAKLNMKNGDTLDVTRCGNASFERLDSDDFLLVLNGKVAIYKQAKLEVIAEYIDKNYI